MNGVDRQQLFGALVLLITALFVSSGFPSAGPWRRRLRLAAIAGFFIALVVALADTLCWWWGLSW